MMDGRTNKPWFRKGWCVSYDKTKDLYRAHSDTRPPVKYGSSKDYRVAIRYAISGALKHGRLNWKATLEWGKMKNIHISYDDALGYAKYTPHKGWYVRVNGSKPKCPRYEVLVGETVKTAKMIGSTRTRRQGIKLALSIVKSKPYYNKNMTIEWLKRMDLTELLSIV